MARVKKSRQAEVKRALTKIFHAACLEDALAGASESHRRYWKEFPTAAEVLAQGLGDCLTFYRFPELHWKRIRTSNLLERASLEVRRRTDVIKRLPIVVSNLFAIGYIFRSRDFIRVHKERARRVLERRVLEIHALDLFELNKPLTWNEGPS